MAEEKLLDRIVNTEQSVKVMQKENEIQNRIFTKLEEAVEKLQDLTESMHRLISIHDEKLRTQQKSIEDIEEQMKEEITELEDKLQNVHQELSTKIDKSEERILAKIAELQQEWVYEKKRQQEKKDSFGDKLQQVALKFEGWKWFIIGGIFVAGLFMGHSGILGNILSIFKLP